MSNSYRTIDELYYYASDYNKWLGVECSKEMTVNNIDVIQYKRSKGILRITEFKRQKEGRKDSQVELLKVLAGGFRVLNSILKVMPTGNPSLNTQKWLRLETFPTEFQVYVVVGDYPFENTKVINMLTGNVQWLNYNAFKSFSEFRLDLD